jgi:Dihydrodipicolinate synthetase family
MTDLRTPDLRTPDLTGPTAGPDTGLRNQLQGLWLPLVTPFRNGELDQQSLRRLIRHYARGPIDGLILAATSGEGMTLGTTELEQLVELTRAELTDSGRTMPICLGLSGVSTRKMQDMLDETAAWPIDGYLIAAPYYVRPTQRGLLAHFSALADHAAWPIVLYNIPYRTSVNLTNETLLALAEHPNIVGLKDCGADRAQSIDLLRRRPPGFSGPDRRGRAIFRRTRRRRRWRDIAVSASRDRKLRIGANAAEAGRPRCGPGMLGERFRSDQAVVRRAEPVAGEVLAVANRADRQRRGSSADGGGRRGARGTA